jgi:aspartyl-tRNA(Asn)/glutamyl-tRNA(Gln) amidotransferase subunit A
MNPSVASLAQWRMALDGGDGAALADRTQVALGAAQSALNAVISTVPRTPETRSSQAGDLAGIPFVHKDLFCTAGVRTSCGSRMLAEFVPPYDATVAERLNMAGAICVGKANMDEFAMGSSNENSYFGSVRNPWDLDRVPGGSSGGSAALVAAGVVPFATGSDTGGSVRQPAAFCGITGIKPTYGRVSRYGMIAYASSLDQAGVLARRAEDCARVLQCIAGPDPRDATCAERAVDDFSAALSHGVRGLRVGVVRELFGAGVEPAVASATHSALRELEAAGAHLVDVSLPALEHAIAAYYVIAPAEASSNLARYDGVRYGHRCAQPKDLEDLYRRSRTEGFGAEVRRRILAGTYVLSAGYYDAYYVRAQRVRRLIANDFARAFLEVDLLAGPTTPTPAFKLGEKLSDPLAMYAADINTVAVNLAGLPAMSLPAGFVDGLPVGLQLIGAAFDEARLFAAGHALQQRTEHHLARAPGAVDV